MTTHMKALFENNNLQKLSQSYTANRKHVSKRDSIWIIFEEKQAVILDTWYQILGLLWLNYFQQKITSKEGGGEKKWLDLIFELRIIHTFMCGKRKGKLKIKAKCRMFDW